MNLFRKKSQAIKNIQLYDLSLPRLKKYVEKEYSLIDNCAKVDVDLTSYSSVYNPLSYEDQKDLNEEIYEYINDTSYYVPTDYSLKLVLHTKNTSLEEQEKIKAMISRHYTKKMLDRRLDLKINSRYGIGMFILGTIAILVYLIVSIFVENPLFIEVLSIVGSFTLWTSLDILMVQRRDIRLDYFNQGQLAIAQIEFDNKDVKKKTKKKELD